MSRRQDPFDTPLHHVLEALREWCGDSYRAHAERLDSWSSYCPGCRSYLLDRRTLAIREAHRGGPVTLWCSQGCSEGDVLAVLFPESPPATWADPFLVAKVAMQVIDQRRRAEAAHP